MLFLERLHQCRKSLPQPVEAAKWVTIVIDSVADDRIQAYLEALRRHAEDIRVPGLDLTSGHLPLQQVFVEPRVDSGRGSTEGQGDDRTERRPLWAQRMLLMRDRILVRADQGRPESSGALDFQTPEPEPVGRVLVRDLRSVILGEPGQGKSTLLRQYATSLLHGSERRSLPLLVELGRKRDISPEEHQDFCWLYQRLPPGPKLALGGDGWASVCAAIRSDSASLLLDGLDELSPQARIQVRELISELARTSNQMVITSRPDVYRHCKLDGFNAHRLRLLEWSQIVLLVESVCRSLAPEFGARDQPAQERVLELARGLPSPLAGNPMLLSFICLTAIRRQGEGTLQEFPVTPSAIIGECFEVLIEWHRTRRTDDVWPMDLDYPRVIKLLSSLALNSFLDGSHAVGLDGVAKLAETDRRLVLGPLVSGRFLERREHDYAFPLETFREFLAAQAVLQNCDPLSVLEAHLHHPSWAGVTVYTAAGLTQHQPSLFDFTFPNISRAMVKYFGPIQRILAQLVGIGSWVGPAKETVATASELLVQELRGPLERWQARSRHSAEFFLARLFRHCPSRYRSALGWDLRLVARCVVATAHCPEATATALTDGLLKRHFELGVWPWSTFLGALLEASQCLEVRKRVLELTWHQDSLVGEAAARALSYVAADEEVRERLLELTAHPHSRVCCAAVEALELQALQPQVHRRLLELLGSADAGLRSSALFVLRTVAHEDLRFRDLLQLQDDADPQVRSAVAQLLATATQVEDVKGCLLRMTEDPVESVRVAATAGLGNFSCAPSVQERLLQLAVERRGAVRAAAARALKNVSAGKAIRDCLLSLLDDLEPSVRLAAAYGLSEAAAGPEYLDRLLGSMRYSDLLMCRMPEDVWRVVANAVEVRKELAEMLTEGDMAAIGRPDKLVARAVAHQTVRDWLLGLALDSDACVRAEAASALGPVAAEPLVRSRLLALTTDEDHGVRAHAADGLGSAILEPTVRERLLELTRDRHSWVREAAVMALKPIVSEPEVLRRVLRQTWHPSKWLREAATWALSDVVTTPKVLRRFLSLTRHESSHIHRMVAEALAKAYESPGVSKRQRRSIMRTATRFARYSVHGLELLEVLVQPQGPSLRLTWSIKNLTPQKPPSNTDPSVFRLRNRD